MPRVSADHEAEIRDRIVVAALHVFGAKGYHRTTIADIVRESGLSVGAIYTYFPGKDAIYLATCDMTAESPTPKVSIKGRMYKPYWGEGSNRARNWQRYMDDKGHSSLRFEEGVDGYVPVVGSVNEVLEVTLDKLRSTMCNLGSTKLGEFMENAVLTLVSEQSVVEGGTDNIVQIDSHLDDDK
jgi:AcrR family transcriptional regulator